MKNSMEDDPFKATGDAAAEIAEQDTLRRHVRTHGLQSKTKNLPGHCCSRDRERGVPRPTKESNRKEKEEEKREKIRRGLLVANSARRPAWPGPKMQKPVEGLWGNQEFHGIRA